MTQTIHVLVIDDDHDDFTIIKYLLSKITTTTFDVHWCSDYDTALGELLKNEHDIYFIDHFLGKGQGVDLIKQSREAGIDKPMILLTGAGNEAVDQKGLKSGASDFLVKSELRSDTIERTIRYSLERYHQQQFVRKQEKKYRSLFELSMDPITILNDALQIIEYNEAFMRQFNIQPQHDFVPFAQLFAYDFDFQLLAAEIQKEGYVKNWKTILKIGEEQRTVILSIAALPMENIAQTNFHVVVHDITELLQTQQEVQQLEKLSMTGRMARIIAHEVRNPLTNIHLALGELKESKDNAEDFETYTAMISRNAERITKLTDDLLSSTKPSEPEIVPANMNEIIASALEACQDRINLLNIQLDCQLPKEPIQGRWDPEKLKIAFINIMINAIEAMQETDQPQLKIQLDGIHHHPIIRIADNGKGMNEETLSKIFDPFYSNRQGGMGLGMTATHNIIRMHRGKINVHSAPGKGTEFEIQL